MRSIKFRAWDGKQMLYFPELWMCNEYASVCFSNYTEEGYLGTSGFIMVGFDWENSVVTQFTGLHDKNGKEIYEGDIAIIESDIMIPFEGFTGVVKYMECGFYLDNDKEAHNVWSDVYQLNVIGNIYETPEPLKS